VLTLLLVCGFIGGCDYARMKDDEAVNTFQTTMPAMDRKAVPVGGGEELLKETDPDTLENPVPAGKGSVARGRTAYGYYCVQCHGPNGEGFGTVGQSFSPLPTNLRDGLVQEQSDGMLFYTISLGYKRHPPLARTVAPEDRWAIINYIRSIVEPPRG
jgi:mono/diheme cytochrome c family protein